MILAFFVEKQVFKYDDIGIVSRVRVNGRLFLVPKEELDALVSTILGNNFLSLPYVPPYECCNLL